MRTEWQGLLAADPPARRTRPGIASLPATGWRHTFTSGHYFTRWSWLLSLPFAVIILGGYDAADDTRSHVVGVAMAVAVHILMGIVGLAAALAERHLASPAGRGLVVWGALCVIAVARPLVNLTLAAALNVPPFPGGMFGRVLTNFIVGAIALTMIATVVAAFRRRRLVLTALHRVTDALSAQRTQGRYWVDRARESVSLSRQELQRGFQAMAEGAVAETRAARLGVFAATVARPISHTLFTARDNLGDLTESLSPSHVAWRATDRRPFALVPIRVGWTTMLYMFIVIPWAASRLLPVQWLVVVLIGAVIGVGGEWLTVALWRRLSRPVAEHDGRPRGTRDRSRSADRRRPLDRHTSRIRIRHGGICGDGSRRGDLRRHSGRALRRRTEPRQAPCHVHR